MDMDLDAMHDDVRVDEEILGFVEGLSRKKGRKRYFRNFWILDVLVYKRSTFKKLKYETLKTNFLKIPNFCFGLQDGLIRPVLTFPKYDTLNYTTLEMNSLEAALETK